ncbi:hypothetical protein Ga0451573_000753 [Peptococcaceae bacterium DYL19]|nr:hypothetical protein [Phosphitispora fastidiosa]
MKIRRGPATVRGSPAANATGEPGRRSLGSDLEPGDLLALILPPVPTMNGEEDYSISVFYSFHTVVLREFLVYPVWAFNNYIFE